MKKKNIVKTKEEFNNIINTGFCNKNKYFVVYSKENKKEYDCFGISVGKKIGNAVTRNKYKRKIRNIIDIYRKDYVNSKDYIIILRSNALSITFEEMKENLIILLNKGAKQ
ncbi:MAG: ribonuclease P protein component [Bacilli bacterium]|nr:ribonuclease P protein component [Bacilli bacterium]